MNALSGMNEGGNRTGKVLTCDRVQGQVRIAKAPWATNSVPTNSVRSNAYNTVEDAQALHCSHDISLMTGCISGVY